MSTIAVTKEPTWLIELNKNHKLNHTIISFHSEGHQRDLWHYGYNNFQEVIAQLIESNVIDLFMDTVNGEELAPEDWQIYARTPFSKSMEDWPVILEGKRNITRLTGKLEVPGGDYLYGNIKVIECKYIKQCLTYELELVYKDLLEKQELGDARFFGPNELELMTHVKKLLDFKLRLKMLKQGNSK